MLAETVLEDKAYYASMDIPVCRPKDPRYGWNTRQNFKSYYRTQPRSTKYCFKIILVICTLSVQ